MVNKLYYSQLSKMTEKELAEFKRVEEEERNRRDIAFEKFLNRVFSKGLES